MLFLIALLFQFPPQSITVTIDPHLAALTAADGTSCTLDRTPGSATPSLDLNCVTPGLTGTQTYTMGSWLPSGYYAQMGDVVCWLGMNPLGPPLPGTPLLPPWTFYQIVGPCCTTPPGTVSPFTLQVPYYGAAWSCTTNIWSGGVVTSQTPMVQGTAVWP